MEELEQARILEETGGQKQSKHIALYISSLTKGGAERVFKNLAEYLYEQGHRVTLITTYMDADEYTVKHASWREATAEEMAAGDPYVREVMRPDESRAYVKTRGNLPEGERGIFRIFSGLLKQDQTSSRAVNLTKRTKILHDICEKVHPDLLLSANGKNNIMALLSTIGLEMPVVVSVVANPTMEYASRQTYLSMVTTFRRASGVVLQMRAQQSFFPPAVQERVTILSNPLDKVFLRERYEGTREKTIVSVGRMDRNKNHAMLIKAFARLKPTHPEWRLVLYGDGMERRRLVNLAKSLGVMQSVEFAGQVDDVADRIYEAGCFVLCSNEEGMPNALMEAMALGLPCVSTDCPCGGPKELIQDGVNGLLTPVNDPVRLEKTLLRILDNPGFSATMGRNAARLQETHHPDKVNAEWEAYLLDIIRRYRAPADEAQ